MPMRYNKHLGTPITKIGNKNSHYYGRITETFPFTFLVGHSFVAFDFISFFSNW